MNANQFNMHESCKQALCPPANANKELENIKAAAMQAMSECDIASEEGRLNHGALLLFLCAIDDLEKLTKASGKEKSTYFMRAVQKIRCAESQFTQTQPSI